MLYSVETPEGVKNIREATILDSKMALVKVGDNLKITYKGLAEAKKGKNPAKIFKVEEDKDETEEKPAEKIELLDIQKTSF